MPEAGIQVPAGTVEPGEDHQMVFRFYWLPFLEAQDALAVEQGSYVGYIE